MSTYVDVSPEEAQNLVRRGDCLVLDARDPHSYKEGHIDGAVLVHEGLTRALLRQRKTPRPVLVYCYLGNSSRDIAQLLSNAGYPEVHNLSGGYTAWKKLGESV